MNSGQEWKKIILGKNNFPLFIAKKKIINISRFVKTRLYLLWKVGLEQKKSFSFKENFQKKTSRNI